MSTDAESLVALERLLQEFYASSTDNLRKKQIEETLTHFSKQHLAWKHCLYFLTNTTNEYVHMFCLNVVENVINQQWMAVKLEDRLMMRTTIYQLLLLTQSNVSGFVRNKMAKVIVLIARLDWPHAFPDFFSNILSLSHQRETVVLSLILLQLTSEELASPREGALSTSRRNELRQLLLHQVPNVMSLLTNLLESSLDQHKATVTATPPPSPTNQHSTTEKPLTSTPIKHGLLHHKSHVTATSSLLSASVKLQRFDSHSHVICSVALRCLIHLFSWIPLSSSITPSILRVIFRFAEFGCERHAEENQRELGELAMNCINELLTKNCVPPEFEEFLLMMFNQTLHLLQCLTKDDDPKSLGNSMQLLDENYLDKFTEFLQLFVRLHLKRFEVNPHFPTLNFLGLVFRYTFKQPTNESFFNCLAVWSEFLDYLTVKLEERLTNKNAYLQKYEEALTSLAADILKKLQFRYNQSQLDLLDDDVLDDDFKTEWQYFLAECLETVAKVTQLYPLQMFTLLYEPFQEYMTVYFDLERYITDAHLKRQLNVTAENDCRRLHCALRDLSSFLQAYGRLSCHFTGENFTQTVQDGCILVEKLIQTSVYGTKMKLYEIGSSIKNVLEGDFIEVLMHVCAKESVAFRTVDLRTVKSSLGCVIRFLGHAQAMGVVKAYSCWLNQFYQHTRSDDQRATQCHRMIEGIVDTVVPLLLEESVPEKLLLSASHLLLSLCTTVRPAYLYHNPLVQKLFQEGIKVNSCPPEVELLTFRSLSHYLMLPWPGIHETKQDWETRSHSLTVFLGQVLGDLKRICEISGLQDNPTAQSNARWCIIRSLSIMTDIVEHLSAEGVSRSKQMCHAALRDYIHIALCLVPIYVQDYEITFQFLGFFLALFRTIRVQMGSEFVEKVIQTFLNLFTRELILDSLHQESAYGHQLIDRFLKLLLVIVQEPGSSFRKLLPSILDLCLSQIYPVLSVRDSPDVKPSLFELLYQFLQLNWRYFFPGSVLESVNNQAMEKVENKDQFIQIMQAFGQSFLQMDISLFRQNLESLESLNAKHYLYRKPIFRDMMLNQFISVLLQTLLQRSHNLLQDEITFAVYNMASVNFTSFYGQFIPEFLHIMKGISDHQRAVLIQTFHSETDLPSFVQNIQSFVNDLRFYHLCSTSLPEGSVKL